MLASLGNQPNDLHHSRATGLIYLSRSSATVLRLLYAYVSQCECAPVLRLCTLRLLVSFVVVYGKNLEEVLARA